MRVRVHVFVLGFVFVTVSAAYGLAQQQPSASNTSLGDVARQLKAQKAKEPKPAKVFTNDNLPSSKGDESEVEASASAKNPASSASKDSAAAPEVHGEEYFRSHLSTLQSRLDAHKRELDVLQQKLSQNQVQYYPDPNKTLQQEYTREDINKLTADVDAKKQQIADDEKAIEDLHDQLRRDGGDPGWLR